MLNQSSANLEHFMSWQTCVLFSSTPMDIWYTCPLCRRLISCFLPLCCRSTSLPITLYLSPHSLTVRYLSWLSTFSLPPVFSPFSLCALMFHLFFFSSILCFRTFCHLSFPLSVSLSLTLPLHFHFSTSPPLFTFSLQWGHSMNNSKALQDDNGKLEVRLCSLCVCGVCVCKISWFIPARRQL